MPFAGKGASNATSEGWLRDASVYWREILDRHPQAFDEFNRSVLRGEVGEMTAPVNNAAFRAMFPQYDLPGLRGESLLHHHIGGGGQAAAVPASLHPGSGGIHNIEKALGIWAEESETARMLERLLEKLK
jgi:hypothetical protein